MKLTFLVLIYALVGLYDAAPVGAAPITPHRANLGEVKKFLSLLDKSLPNGEKQFVSKFTSNRDAVVTTTTTADGSWTNLHSLWIADVNNDGVAEYFWTTEGEGSAHYDYFDVYQLNPGDRKLVELDFPLESSRMPSNLASSPIVQDASGITYLELKNIWAEDAKGKKIYEGANSNAAKDLACLVIVTQEYRWDKTGIAIVYQQTERITYDIDLLQHDKLHQISE